MTKKRKTATGTQLSIEQQFPAVALIARVLANSEETRQRDLSQGELCAEFRVSDQTIRNWMKRGLPWRPGALGKPRYPEFESRAWCQCWLALEAARKYDKVAIGWLTPAHAINWCLQSFYEAHASPEEQGQPFVIVPLDWDHPWRERLLRLAARGAMPPCSVSGIEREGELYTDAFDAVVAEWVTPLPRIDPSPPLPVAPGVT